MTSVIADILKNRLSELEWIERFGGLVSNATRPEFAQGADGAQIVKGYQTYPVACGVNVENCWETGAFKHFEPDSKKSAIAFFVDNGGVTLKDVMGPKNAALLFQFDLKLLCWMNSKRLGDSITAGNCLPSGRVVPYVVSKLHGEHSAVGLFDGGIEEEVFHNVEVTSVRELTKTTSMFEPFTFAHDGAQRGLFISPYDYFGLGISGTFVVNKNCLPEFGADWEAATGCMSWESVFCKRVFNCLSSLIEYDSDEEAIAGGGTLDDEGNIWYITSNSHVSGMGGVPKIANL